MVPEAKFVDRLRFPSGTILTTLFSLALALGLIVPRLTWALVFILALTAIAVPLRRGVSWKALLTPTPLMVALLVIAALAAASGFWSIDPWSSWMSGARLALLAVIGNAAVHAQLTWNEAEKRQMALGLVCAVIVVALLISAEVFSDQWMARQLFETFPKLQRLNVDHIIVQPNGAALLDLDEINRRTAVLTLLLLPALIASWFWLPQKLRMIAIIGLILSYALMIVENGHQASQLAVAVGGLTAALYWFSRRAARVAVVVAWAAIVMLAGPVASKLYDEGLSSWMALPYSARARIVIWNHAAGEMQKRPLLGIGADATAAADRMALPEVIGQAPGGDAGIGLPTHMHSYYIQLMYELGILGSALVCLAGLVVLRSIFRLPPDREFAALTFFTTVAALVSCSWGLWQFWLHAAITIALMQLLQFSVAPTVRN